MKPLPWRRLVALVRERLALDARRIVGRIDRRIYRAGASLARCDATCCRGGVALSLAERDAILEHRDAIAEAMEASARAGVAPRRGAWFSDRSRRDPDFLDGASVDTRVVAGACVFLRADRLCAVQVASEKTSGHGWALKPAYCVLFPLCVEKGAIDACHGWYTRRRACCAPVKVGMVTPRAIFRPVEKLLETLPPRAITQAPPGRRLTASRRRSG